MEPHSEKDIHIDKESDDVRDECSIHTDDWSQLYGEHETQVSEGGEADLLNYKTTCTKNPGHETFIPVQTFTLEHLPEVHRDTDLYELINALADMTVRVSVRMTSSQRPKHWPGTKAMYPFYNMEVRKKLRTGTGMMYGVDKFTSGYRQDGCIHWKNYSHCWCNACQHSDSPSTVWWEIDVDTATHVVFDDVEASHTYLKLFYDREDGCSVILDKVSVVYANVDRDMCVLNCVTCDRDLGHKLDKIKTRFYELLGQVYVKYQKSRDVDKLTFIVSHPHGCSKQVSVGQWRHKQMVGNNEYFKFTYTACTCPGSSGATVFCVGYGAWWRYHLIHSGSLKKRVNYSGLGAVSV